MSAPLTQDAISELVDSLIRERIKCYLTDATMSAHIRDAVASEVRSAVASLGGTARVRERLEDAITTAAKSLVSSDAALIERCLRAVLTVSATVDHAIRDEVRSLASASVGAQVAKRMKRFFRAVDATLGVTPDDE